MPSPRNRERPLPRPQGRPISSVVSDLYRSDYRRIFASLIRLLGDFDLAEESLQEAFTIAVSAWQQDGVPANPRAWLVSTARFKGIDSIRRRVKFDQTVEKHGEELILGSVDIDEIDDETFNDDQLRLIFTCCHPALSQTAQVPLTLREICGLTTEEIASAFLSTPPTIAQRIVRAKAKIREARIPYQVPERDELPERLDAVLSVIYLVFNEGYSASSGDVAIRTDLTQKAIYLGELLLDLLPDSDVMGLLALMLLHESRRAARVDANGDLILLEDQERSLWNRDLIARGSELVERALATNDIGSYTIQAALSAVHANAATAGETDWSRIVELYDLLLQSQPNPVVELNRAVAIAMRDGPEQGIQLIDDLLARGELQNYHLAYAARADFCRRQGDRVEAVRGYQAALELCKQEPERRFLQKRIEELAE